MEYAGSPHEGNEGVQRPKKYANTRLKKQKRLFKGGYFSLSSIQQGEDRGQMQI